jgi:hypothetical protein
VPDGLPGPDDERSARRRLLHRAVQPGTFLELGALVGAVSSTRLHGRLVLLEWGRTALSGDTELLASELITNRVRDSRAMGESAVRMWLVCDRKRAVGFVRDAGPRSSSRADPDVDAESVRGLLLVEAPSESWGHFGYDGEGKVVRAVLQFKRQPRKPSAWPEPSPGRSTVGDEQPRTAQQCGDRLRGDSHPGGRPRQVAAAQAAAGRDEREALGTARPGDPAAGQSSPDQALSVGGTKGEHVERERTPCGHGNEDGISPLLLDALAGLDVEARRAVVQGIALYREFPAWAVWLPHGGRPWAAVRPASARPPGPEVPMIWVQAETAADLAARMRRADAQLAPP